MIALGVAVFLATACGDVLAAWWHRSVTSGHPGAAALSGVMLYAITTAEALLVVRDSPWFAFPGAAGVALGSAVGAWRRSCSGGPGLSARSVPS